MPPLAIVAVPLNGFSQARFERFRRPPAEFTCDLAGIDRVAGIVSGTIGDELDQTIARTVPVRLNLVQQLADHPDDVDVAALVMSADCVRVTDRAALGDESEGRYMILDVEPVSHVLAFSVYGQGIAVERVDDHQGNELLGGNGKARSCSNNS